MQFSKTIFYPLIVASIVSGCGINPKPVSEEEIADFALTDIAKIYESQESIPEVLTLADAMARSLKYNLDNRVKLMEQAVAHKSVEMAKLDMLPSLGVSAGYFDRTNQNASRSVDISTNTENLRYSTSQERRHFTADVRFTWNALDFGVSYLQAVQNADRFLISQKSREKVMLKLLQQVRSAYWRGVVMQKMSKDVEEILKKVNVTLDDLKAVREQQLYTPLFALNDIRLLVETKKQLEELKASISIANIELTSLINVPSSTKLNLEVPCDFNAIPTISKNIKEMELTALINSGDYVSEIYNVRVDQLESRKSLLRLLPGIEFSYAGNYASNSFLWNNLWGELGVRLLGDILKLAVIPDILDYAEVSEHLAISRRLAVNTAVVAGVHLAWQNHTNSINRLEQSSFLNDIDREIADLTRNAEKNRSGSEVEAIQTEFRAFSSQMGHLLSYAQAQDSFGAFLVSLGSNPVPENYQAMAVNDLAQVLTVKYQAWDQGHLELIDPEKMQERIKERKQKEARRGFIAELLDEPISMSPLQSAMIKYDTRLKTTALECDKNESEAKLEVKKQTAPIKKNDAYNGLFVVE